MPELVTIGFLKVPAKKRESDSFESLSPW